MIWSMKSAIVSNIIAEFWLREKHDWIVLKIL
jgi:hypothetical protein